MYGMYSCQLVLRCYFCRYICIYFTPSISMFLVFYLSSFCHSDGLCAFKLFGREGVDEKHLYNLQGKIVKVLLIFCSRCLVFWGTVANNLCSSCIFHLYLSVRETCYIILWSLWDHIVTLLLCQLGGLWTYCRVPVHVLSTVLSYELNGQSLLWLYCIVHPIQITVLSHYTNFRRA